MENKYYTPEIEEFHVGFEYEYNIGQLWQEEIFNRGVGFAPNPTVEDCRVKYLDREDIESLGFKRIDPCRKDWEMYNVGDYAIRIKDGEDRFLRIFKFSQRYVMGEALFKGIIKNKSELKRVLKQIGYGE